MNRVLQSVLAAGLTHTPLGLWPVRVRRGVAQGARWTLFPWTSYWKGNYEPDIQAELCRLGGGDIRGWNCWDLGAHFGLYSVGLARRVGPAGEVAAFEPNPRSFARLRRHQRMNHLPWLKLFCAVVSDHAKDSELYTYGDLTTTTTHLPYDGEPSTDRVGAIRVRSVRLDDLVQSGELRPPRFVKVDVEGHGHRALAGMSATLAAARPILAVALHSPDEIAGTAALLTKFGYAWCEIPGSASRPPLVCGGNYLFTPST